VVNLFAENTDFLGRDDRFLFYYSGHGSPEPDANGHMLLWGATEGRYDPTWDLPVSDIKSWSNRLQAKHVLFLLDGCGLGLGLQEKSASGDLVNLIANNGSKTVFAATRGGENSFGTRDGNHSLFTAEFLKVLRSPNADPDGVGFITIDKVSASMQPGLAAGVSDLGKGEAFNPSVPHSLDPSLSGRFLFFTNTVKPQPRVTAATGSFAPVSKGEDSQPSSVGRDAHEAAGTGSPAPGVPALATRSIPRLPTGPIVKIGLELVATLSEPDPQMDISRLASATGNQTLLASASSTPGLHGKGLTRIWDLTTGQLVNTLQGAAATGAQNAFTGLALSPDGRRAAAGVSNSASLTANLSNYPGPLFSKCPKSFLMVWDTGTGEPVATIGGDGVPCLDLDPVAFSPDGAMIATGCANGNVFVWNTATGALIHTLKHPGVIASIAFSNDGQVLAVGDRNWSPSVRLWNTGTWTILHDLHPTVPSYGEALAFSPDGMTLATGHYRGGIYLWDYRTGAQLRRLGSPTADEGGTGTMAFDRMGRILTFVSDKSLQFWSPMTGKLLGSLITGNGTLVLCQDGAQLAIVAPDRKSIQLWQLRAD
jgi:WD40 repeat protein